MKLKHWIKEYRFRKANQMAMTKYWQGAAEEKRMRDLIYRIGLQEGIRQSRAITRFYGLCKHFPIGSLQLNG